MINSHRLATLKQKQQSHKCFDARGILKLPNEHFSGQSIVFQTFYIKLVLSEDFHCSSAGMHVS